jgi:ABC-type sugar transport system substrate-binding protein
MKHMLARLLPSLLALPLLGAPKIGVMPKLTGIDYFNAVERGARAAGADLGAEVVYDGPVTNDVAKQSAMVDIWIAQRFDAICIAPNDPAAIAPVLRKAMARGIKVITYDADALPSARQLFVNQASVPAVAKALIDSVARNVGPAARYVILTGSATAANQNAWMAEMERYRARIYPRMVNLSPTPKVTEEDQALATQVAIDTLKAYPDMQAMIAMTTVALPGAAEGLVKAGAAGKIFLNGISTPRAMKPYIKAGVAGEVVLWSPEDLGYLAVQVAAQLVSGKITPESREVAAGKLGVKAIAGREVLLGDPLVFDKGNIDNYNF